MQLAFQRICVFCGSSSGNRLEYAECAVMLGRELTRAAITLVYGDGRTGLMRVLADATIAAGGKAVGVMPRALVAKERAHTGLTELQIVNSMHERKAPMADSADAFILLPGGFGSWEEFCETPHQMEVLRRDKENPPMLTNSCDEPLDGGRGRESNSQLRPARHRVTL